MAPRNINDRNIGDLIRIISADYANLHANDARWGRTIVRGLIESPRTISFCTAINPEMKLSDIPNETFETQFALPFLPDLCQTLLGIEGMNGVKIVVLLLKRSK
ncbi:hypothetical protein [Roseibium sp.]|uniref:hypothetical protein n=1 Tax=Roseibium sp. TaxID=1936156 RepID=UPI0025E4E902|nr:hypothetical protein [Roseibium sp.]